MSKWDYYFWEFILPFILIIVAGLVWVRISELTHVPKQTIFIPQTPLWVPPPSWKPATSTHSSIPLSKATSIVPVAPVLSPRACYNFISGQICQ